MAKLIDILARELKAWPKGAEFAVQDGKYPWARKVWFTKEAPEFERGDWTVGILVHGDIFSLAEDFKTAIITREQWRAAVEALKVPVIDWSKAPEWAKAHGVVGTYSVKPAWLGDTHYQYVESETRYKYRDQGYCRDEFRDVVERPAPAAPTWNGEGLPPVGVHCLHRPLGARLGYMVEIIAHFQAENSMVAAFVPLTGMRKVRQSIAVCFEPIKTAEQIAAEAKSKTMAEMLAVFESGMPAHWDTLAGIEALFDAGYHKQ